MIGEKKMKEINCVFKVINGSCSCRANQLNCIDVDSVEGKKIAEIWDEIVKDKFEIYQETLERKAREIATFGRNTVCYIDISCPKCGQRHMRIELEPVETSVEHYKNDYVGCVCGSNISIFVSTQQRYTSMIISNGSEPTMVYREGEKDNE